MTGFSLLFAPLREDPLEFTVVPAISAISISFYSSPIFKHGVFRSLYAFFEQIFLFVLPTPLGRDARDSYNPHLSMLFSTLGVKTNHFFMLAAGFYIPKERSGYQS